MTERTEMTGTAKFRMIKRLVKGPVVAIAAGALGVVGLGVLGAAVPAAAAPASCTLDVGGTGLSAAVVAHSHETIVDQTISPGCDIGIYVGSDAAHVLIEGVTVTGANDHGIFVQDTSNVTIENSTISGNGVDPNSAINENKGVELVGTTNSVVRGNTVTGNLADGGIGIADDGPIDPGALQPGTLLASKNNVVSGNTVNGNYEGCGIVLAAYNPGAGIFNNVVVGNTVTGSPDFYGSRGPVISGIVVAADEPETTVSNNAVVHNTDSGSFIPGIVVHSNAPGDVVSNNSVVGNTLDGDGWGKIDGPQDTVGVLVGAETEGASLVNTTVAANRITNEDYGIYVSAATGTDVGGLPLDQATTPVVGLP